MVPFSYTISCGRESVCNNGPNLIEKADELTTRLFIIAHNDLILQRYHIVWSKKDLTDMPGLYYKTYPARE